MDDARFILFRTAEYTSERQQARYSLMASGEKPQIFPSLNTPRLLLLQEHQREGLFSVGAVVDSFDGFPAQFGEAVA